MASKLRQKSAIPQAQWSCLLPSNTSRFNERFRNFCASFCYTTFINVSNPPCHIFSVSNPSQCAAIASICRFCNHWPSMWSDFKFMSHIRRTSLMKPPSESTQRHEYRKLQRIRPKPEEFGITVHVRESLSSCGPMYPESPQKRSLFASSIAGVPF